MDIKKGYWLNDNGTWYIVKALTPFGCTAVKVDINENGDYIRTNTIKKFNRIEMNIIGACEY